MKAQLTICRPSGGGDDNYISIEVEDDASHTRVLRLSVSLADFAAALTGRASMPAEAEWNLRHLGKTHEHKTVEIGWTYGDDKATAAAPHEVDGWKARLSALGNMHRRVTANTYRVTMDHYVAALPEVPR